MQAASRAMWVGVLVGCLATPIAWAADTTAAPAGASPGYRLPPPALQAVADAPTPPRLVLSPKREWAALLQTPPLPGIAEVAQPELKLAGLRLHPRTRSRSEFSLANELRLMRVADAQEIAIDGLPSPLSLSTVAWSPDQAYLAFNRVDSASGANELWLVEVAAHRAWRVAERLNTVADTGYHWMPDSRSLLVFLQPPGQGAAPADDGIPTGPAIQQTAANAGARSIRTYQDLLRNEADAKRLEYYLASQPARVGLDGRAQPIGIPGLYTDLVPSPDGRYLLSQRVERPFSYLVPLGRFPRRIEVLDANGHVQHQVARLPLVEGLPTGNDAVPTGVREVQWRADAPATLLWAEAQDGGDPSRPARIRDAVLVQAAPFEQPPQTVIELGSRFAEVTWGRGDLALVDEFWWKDRKIRQWRVAPDAPGQAPVLVNERSEEDRYADPGTPVTVDDASGNARLLTDAQGESIYLIGEGASPEGDRPFVDRFDLRDGRRERLFQSQAPFYERPRAVLDAAATQWLTTRESPDAPPNWYVRTLAGNPAAPRALTRFEHPLPQLRGVQKEQIRYKRADGVDLTATLLLPPNYDAERDGPLPMLMWAYPGEYKSAAAASQVTDSPYRFNAVGYWGPQAYLAMGYAVLNNPSMPIIGEGDAEPNDTYLQQLVADAQAAVDEVVRRGVADRERIAIGGHSYGAFMTANLLAHSHLFKAGIARSGAYNRTLTPFGFQSEERNYWQAQPVYEAMSPFNFADRIKAPLLMIHGQDDDNSGTFPIQSERLYAAIKGLGGNARLVMLPNEAHRYRARESIMQMLAESNDWLAQYLGAPASGKKGKAAGAASP